MVSAITITIEDEGYFKKSFSFSPNVKLKKVLDLYLTYVCERCSDPKRLDFWFEATKVRISVRALLKPLTNVIKILDTHTAEILGIEHGDIIDVLTSEHCTRGTCPTTKRQTVPNIHYLDNGRTSRTVQIHELKTSPLAPERIKMNFVDLNGFEMVFRTRVDSEIVHAMQTFASCIRRETSECRFWINGERIIGHETPEEVRSPYLRNMQC